VILSSITAWIIMTSSCTLARFLSLGKYDSMARLLVAAVLDVSTSRIYYLLESLIFDSVNVLDVFLIRHSTTFNSLQMEA
jgi:hypothetical protein